MTSNLPRLGAILLVEDNPGDARLIQEMLRDVAPEAPRPTLAADLASAARILGEHRYDIVLLDLTLPDSRGSATVSAMRAIDPRAPLVVLTGLQDQTVALEALEHGAQDYLVKGQFEAPALLRTIHYAIQRRRLEDKVNHSVSLLRAILDSTADGILVVDNSGAMVDRNRRFDEMWPKLAGSRHESADRLLQALSEELVDPERFRRRAGELHGSVENGYDLLQFRDGRTYERMSIPYAIDGAVVGRVWSFRDVTERRQAIEDLRSARQIAEAANRAKTEFLSDLSHEIRTPLNSFIGASDLVAGTPLDEEQRGYVAMMQRSSTALLALVNDTLDLTKIESGRLELESTPFDLAAVVADVVELCRPSAARKGLSLTSDTAVLQGRRVLGDPHRLRQILVNLLSNAVKFTERGGVAVNARDEGPSGTVHFTLSDTGIGIPPERHAVIFESFRQGGASTTRQYGGTGLGLSLTRRLVERMGGSIWLESEVGQGTRFHVSIPFSTASTAAPATPPPPTQAPATDADAAPARILLADDCQDNRELFGHYLRNTPYAVDFAEDGEVAVRKFQAGSYDLVLMDLQMPKLDGNSAVKGIRLWEREQGRPATPIVVLTAQAEDRAIERSLESGCTGYLTKPVRRSQLIAAIQQQLRRPEARA